MGPKRRTRSKARVKAKAGRRRKVAPGPSPIPPGFRTVTAYLAIEGASNAIEFYKKAFGARELNRQAAPDGKLLHASIRIGDTIVMMSDIFPGSQMKSPAELGASTVSLHVYSKDADSLWNRALAAGAKVAMPLENQFWGERYGTLVDPFGHRWSLSMRIRMSKEEKEAKQKAAMEMFSQGQHPGSQGGQAPEPPAQQG